MSAFAQWNASIWFALGSMLTHTDCFHIIQVNRRIHQICTNQTKAQHQTHTDATTQTQPTNSSHPPLPSAGNWIHHLCLNGHSNVSSLVAFASSLPLLQHSITSISCEFCNQLQNSDLAKTKVFTQLTSINLNACRNITDNAIQILVDACADKQIRRLELYWDVVLADKSILSLSTATFAPQLTHVNFSGLKHISDKSFVPFIQRCTSLTFLDITRCEALGDASLKMIGVSCPLLRTLICYATPNFSDAGFEAATNVTNSGAQTQTASTASSSAAGLSQLTYLDLTGMKLITDRTISALAKNCPKLRTLHLMWCTQITDGALKSIGQTHPLHQLTFLSIHGNIHITDVGMELLSVGCPNIEILDVNGCKNIGKYRMNKNELQKIFPKLNKLILL